jgi:site-specific recombinase XerD
MKTVQPIRDEKKIKDMRKILYAQNLRDYAWFTLGINSGLRISDILNLTFNDVLNKDKLKPAIEVKEKKTKKTKAFPLGKITISALQEYIYSLESYELHEPLFFSKKRKDGSKAPISRQHAHYVISECAKAVGITESIGTHTLRKTFGYMAYKKGIDITRIQKLLNHDSPATTLSYIGITKEELDDIYINMELG